MLLTLVTNLSYSFFLTTLFFTISLSLLKSTESGDNLSISSLTNSVFKLPKFDFSAKLLTSTYDTFFRSVFVT